MVPISPVSIETKFGRGISLTPFCAAPRLLSILILNSLLRDKTTARLFAKLGIPRFAQVPSFSLNTRKYTPNHPAKEHRRASYGAGGVVNGCTSTAAPSTAHAMGAAKKPERPTQGLNPARRQPRGSYRGVLDAMPPTCIRRKLRTRAPAPDHRPNHRNPQKLTQEKAPTHFGNT